MHKLMYLIVFLVLASTTVYAQAVPPSMSYQGYVTDLAGTPVADGNYNFTFAVYANEIGGVALWTETHPTVAVSKGLFNVILGRGNPPNPLAVPFDQPYFLGIRMGADPEMAPRVRLTTSAYSFRSQIANEVRDGSITNASVAPGANIAAPKLESTVLTESEIVAGSGVTVNNAGGTLTISASPGAVTLAGDVTGPAGANVIANNAVTAAKILPDVVSSISGVTNDAGNINLVAGANVTITPDDAANTITIAAVGGGGGLTLPFSQSINNLANAFDVTNSGAGGAGKFTASSGATQTYALEAISTSTNSNSAALYATAGAGAAVAGQNNGTAPAGFLRNAGPGNGLNVFAAGDGHSIHTTKSGGAGRAINISYNGTSQAVFIDNNSAAVGLELKQDGTGNAAYFHIDNTATINNALKASTASTNSNSDALEVDAVAGNALDAGNSSAVTPTIYASNSDASTTAPIIMTSGNFRTDRSGKTTSPTYVASSNLGAGVPAAGGIYKDNVVCAWARVSTTGVALASFGCSVSRTAAGQYRVTYNNAFTSSNDACPVVTAHYALGARFAMISVVNANYVDVETYNSSGVLADSYFHIIVLGRQ